MQWPMYDKFKRYKSQKVILNGFNIIILFRRKSKLVDNIQG